jgi:Polyketide cyclase / dehydrase and lipid transport
MPQLKAGSSAKIDAPAAKIYAIIADYRTGHPSILPERYFKDLTVEKGGVGAGTVIKFKMTIMGTTRDLKATITEPEPGRVLVETYEAGEVTTFTVEPITERQTKVSISTVWNPGWFIGLIQRLPAPKILRRVYDEELQKLARVAAEPPK